MSAHTPAPWSIDDCDGEDLYRYIFAPAGEHGHTIAIARIALSREVKQRRVLEANARLMAFAPELLEALKLVRDAAWPHLFIEQQNAIDAAIAKATPEARP